MKRLLLGALASLFAVFVSEATAQNSIYISSEGSLHYEGGAFASGVIDNTNGGSFSINSNFVHSEDNYVEGPVSFLSANTFDVSLEDGSTNREPSFTTTATGTISYDPTAVPTGTAPSGYKLASSEIYSFTGSVSEGSATPLSSTTFDGANGSLIVVYSDSNGGTWSQTATPGVTTVMTFARIDALSNELLSEEEFLLYPNPVVAKANTISYNLPSNIDQLSIRIFDLTGKLIGIYNDVAVKSGINSINKPNISQGVYLVQFSFNNGVQLLTKRLIVE